MIQRKENILILLQLVSIVVSMQHKGIGQKFPEYLLVNTSVHAFDIVCKFNIRCGSDIHHSSFHHFLYSLSRCIR